MRAQDDSDDMLSLAATASGRRRCGCQFPREAIYTVDTYDRDRHWRVACCTDCHGVRAATLAPEDR